MIVARVVASSLLPPQQTELWKTELGMQQLLGLVVGVRLYITTTTTATHHISHRIKQTTPLREGWISITLGSITTLGSQSPLLDLHPSSSYSYYPSPSSSSTIHNPAEAGEEICMSY